jgi:hypothetical protein
VGVFRIVDNQEEQIGEYVRNYTTLFHTFYPFVVNDKTYALYSPHYTATRVMELPTCKDVGGEEPASGGFCPVDYFVPTYALREWIDLTGQPQRARINNPTPEDLLPKTITYYRVNEETGEHFAVETPTAIVTPRTF